MGRLSRLIAALLLCASPAIHADDDLRRRAGDLGLDRQEGWLALGHYRRTALGDWVSDADEPTFFLAAAGKTDPKAELDATLGALLSTGTGDQHAACRFPARYHWLKARLRLDLPEPNCPAFARWRDELRADAVSLIFPTAHLNSPSSMFGHTFLRLDRKDQTADGEILAYTVNYAADALDDDNELVYAYRGLFGGYPGRITVLPYYAKIREYRDVENRDIWEYRLNLGADEVAQLVRHVWELHEVRFDYFFIGENCSYRLLGLLDVARPGLALRSRFPLRTIPADTVRALVSAGLVTSTRFRPSAATELTNAVDQLPRAQRDLARRLADEQSIDLEGLAGSEQAGVLETAYAFSRYRQLKDRLPREAVAKPSLRLLKARSRIAAPSPFRPPAEPDTRDDQGHEPMRVGLGLGYLDHRGYGELALRSAYHDLTDPAPGYRQGAQIKFLDGSLRYDEDDRLRLERLDIIGIRSLSPRNPFLKPISWGIAFGAYRKLQRSGRPLLGYLSGETGLAYDVLGGLAFATLGARFETGESLRSGVDVGLGPRVGWLYRGLGGQGMVGFELDCYLIDDPYCGAKLSANHTVNLGRDFALRLNLSRERGPGSYANEIGLSLMHYF